MLVTQGNSAPFYLTDSSAGSSRSSYEQNLPVNFYRQPERTQALPELPRDYRLRASDLGRYSGRQLQELAAGQRAYNPQEVISSGSESAGYYSRRNLFVEPARLNRGAAGYVNGQFIVNADYYINGQPTPIDPASTAGRFPVNGQYFLNSQYRQSNAPGNPSNGIPYGQYPINESDSIGGQFQYNAVVESQGEIDRLSPYYISSGQFRNGRFLANLGFSQYSLAEIAPIEIQAGRVQSPDRSQILVNGQNTFYGLFRPTLSNSNVILNSQTGRVLVEGSYNDQGEYEVNGQALKSGVNVIQGYAASGSVLTPVEVTVQGRYTSGGQFLIQSDASSRDRSNVRPRSERQQDEFDFMRNAELKELSSQLSTLTALFGRFLNKVYGMATQDSKTPGLFLSFIA